MTDCRSSRAASSPDHHGGSCLGRETERAPLLPTRLQTWGGKSLGPTVGGVRRLMSDLDVPIIVYDARAWPSVGWSVHQHVNSAPRVF